MSVNNFDDHIFDEMSQLRIKPGPHVFGQVQAELRRKRRRRVAAWLLPILLVGFSGIVWWMNDNKEVVPSNQMTQLNQSNDQNSTLIDTLVSPNKNNIVLKEEIKEVISEKSSTEPILLADNSMTDKRSIRQNNTAKENAVQYFNNTDQTPIKETLVSTHEKENTTIEETIHEVVEEIQPNPTVDTLSIQYIPEESIALNSDSEIPPTPEKKKSKSKWSFGVQTNAGESGVGSGNLSESVFKSSMVYNISPGEAAANYATNKDELRHQSNKTYQIGVFAAKPINERVTVKTGVEYQYYSTRTNVGFRVIDENYEISNLELLNGPEEVFLAPGSRTNGAQADGSIQGMMPIEAQTYNNYWHYAAIPVEVNYLITPTKANYGVSVFAGIKYQRLMAANVLHFDERNGLMFRLEDLVNKNQWLLNTGLNIEMFRNHKTPVMISPNVGFQMNQFYQPNLNTDHRSWMAGLRVGVKIF